jgi:hypothetical protein
MNSKTKPGFLNPTQQSKSIVSRWGSLVGWLLCLFARFVLPMGSVLFDQLHEMERETILLVSAASRCFLLFIESVILSIDTYKAHNNNNLLDLRYHET